MLFNFIQLLFKSLRLKFLSAFWQLKLLITDSTYMLNAGKNKLPDFLIIGVPKGGTTYLYDLLNQHPSISMSRRKEIHFFDRNYHRGKRYYRSFFPKSDLGMLTGEASVNYFYSDTAMERIQRDLPSIKLILLLRNPIDRAYSHFQMNKKDMVEKSFEKHIYSVGFEQNKYQYLEKGLYAMHLDRWRSFLEKGQLLIIKSEDLFEDDLSVINRVLGFLGLSEEVMLASKNKNSLAYKALSLETRQELMDYFKEDMANLENEFGSALTWKA